MTLCQGWREERGSGGGTPVEVTHYKAKSGVGSVAGSLGRGSSEVLLTQGLVLGCDCLSPFPNHPFVRY